MVLFNGTHWAGYVLSRYTFNKWLGCVKQKDRVRLLSFDTRSSKFMCVYRRSKSTTVACNFGGGLCPVICMLKCLMSVMTSNEDRKIHDACHAGIMLREMSLS